MSLRRINLLPAEERQKASRERGLLYAAAILVLALTAFGGLYVLERGKATDKQTQLAEVQTQVTQVRADVDKLKPYEVMQSQRVAMAQAAQQVFDSRVVWSSIAEEISLLIPKDVGLTAFHGTVPPEMLAGSALGTVAPAGGGGSTDLSFEGEAYTHKDVADFMTRLGLMPQITDIKLVSAEKTEQDGKVIVKFQITAELRPFLQAPPFAIGAPATGQTGGTGQ